MSTRRAELSEASTPTTEAGRVHVGRFKPKNDSQKLAYELVISDTIAIEAQAFMRGMDRANGLNESKARDLLAATEDAAAQTAAAVEALRDLLDVFDAGERSSWPAVQRARALLAVIPALVHRALTTEEAESAGEGCGVHSHLSNAGYAPCHLPANHDGMHQSSNGVGSYSWPVTPTTRETDQ